LHGTATLNGKNLATTDDVATKANQADLTTLQNTVNGKASQTDLTALTNTVNGKANQGDLDALKTNFDGYKTTTDSEIELLKKATDNNEFYVENRQYNAEIKNRKIIGGKEVARSPDGKSDSEYYYHKNGKVNENVSGLTGVAVMNGSTLINEASGKILIDADNSSGVVIRGKRDASGNLIRNAVIKNYGEIKVRGKGATAISWKDVSAEDIANLQKMINDKITSDPNGREIGQAAGSNKDFQGISITVQDGKPIFRRNGKKRFVDEIGWTIW